MFKFTSLSSDPVRLNKIIHETNAMTDEEFVEKQIEDFLASKSRKEMITGEDYYEGKHDILEVKRTVIGQGGELEEVENLPNNQIIDNQYQKMVDQKKNYLLGKPIIFQSENKTYNKLLDDVLNKRFQRLIKNIGEDALNCGIGWLFLNYDDKGTLSMRRLKPYQVIPGWSDFEHEELEYLIYFYDWESPSGEEFQKVEVYDSNGISRFIRTENKLIPDEEPFSNYFSAIDEEGNETPFNWLQLPIIPFRYNTKEIPLIRKVKSLQDAINKVLSTFANNMEEDARNTILILVNYDGQNLGEFRRNLAQYGAVKVRNDSTTGGGDVKTLQVEVNAENYKVILKLFKDALIENARGYDGKDDRLNGTPNQMNIQSMYSDIDLDANEMETEFQASFEQMLYFIDIHFVNSNKGEYEEIVDVVFNRDMMLNESEIITNIRNSTGVISRKSQVKNHPWIDNVDEEMQLIDEEETKVDEYENAFKKVKTDEVE
ncbi:phage portal protein [Desemzia sp. FAM 23991]|uniref:phage portal protein n=1 Tax=unclassified Desemzia TaxID=2685243 RepID=UPI00388723D4